MIETPFCSNLELILVSMDVPLNVVFATNFSSLEYKYFRCKAGESAAISPLIRGIWGRGG